MSAGDVQVPDGDRVMSGDTTTPIPAEAIEAACSVLDDRMGRFDSPGVDEVALAISVAAPFLLAAERERIDGVLDQLGHDMRQQADARDRLRRSGEDATSDRMDQGRWAFYEAARILCSATDRVFADWLDENGYEDTRIARTTTEETNE